MTPSIRRLLTVLAAFNAAPVSAATAQPPELDGQPPGPPPAGWVHTQINAEETPTEFSVVSEAGRSVLQAASDDAASSLIHTLAAPVSPDHRLHWQWKVSNAVPESSMADKATDDYAARVYVFFDYDRNKLSWAQRTKMDLAQRFWGADLPTAALCYVWGTKDAVGAIGPNPYTDRVRMVVLQSGEARAGRWVSEVRDLAADFKAAFGEDAPPVTGIAVAADTDNTGAKVQARFADIRFEAPSR